MPKTKTYPDRTLENAIRAAGHRCPCLWEMRGPKNTEVAWIVAYAVGHSVVMVQTFKNGNGWNAYSSAPTIRVDDTIADVLERAGLAPGDDGDDNPFHPESPEGRAWDDGETVA